MIKKPLPVREDVSNCKGFDRTMEKVSLNYLISAAMTSPEKFMNNPG